MIVQLYNTESSNPVNTRTVTIAGSRSAAGVARYSCHTGSWYGKVTAGVYWGPGYSPSSRSYGPLTGAQVEIRCVA